MRVLLFDLPSQARFSGRLLSFLLAIAGRSALAQQGAPPHGVYTYVQQPPQLPGKGGLSAIVAAVQQQVVYPSHAVPDSLARSVFISLIVAPDGSIYETKIVRSLRADCDSAALAAARRLPRLVPARQNGRAVYFQYVLPVSFRPVAASPR